MEQIAQYWIKDAIKPSGSPQCGNHVAARWYSGGSARFLDFTPPLATYYEEYSLVLKNYNGVSWKIFLVAIQFES